MDLNDASRSGDPAGALEHVWVDTGEVRLHVAQAGPRDGPLVVLLHGFPEFWYGWRHQIPALAAAGFRVWAPDQRGYNQSDKPRGVDAYALDRVAGDVLGLLDAAGRQSAAVVGHDWGGAVGWWLASRHPERVERLAVLNCPHPRVLRHALLFSPAQALRSAYAVFFQLPRLPEALLGAGNGAPLARSLLTTSRPGTFSETELGEYRRAWAEPGALSSMINWYRAFLRARPRRETGRVPVPTLLVWGARDRFLGRELIPPTLALCDRGRLELLEGATHWLQHEEPETVNRLLVEFLGAAPEM